MCFIDTCNSIFHIGVPLYKGIRILQASLRFDSESTTNSQECHLDPPAALCQQSKGIYVFCLIRYYFIWVGHNSLKYQ